MQVNASNGSGRGTSYEPVFDGSYISNYFYRNG
jgi:hypothetical protein